MEDGFGRAVAVVKKLMGGGRGQQDQQGGTVVF